MKVIVGLGNPGEKYTQTRHNLGFLVIDYLIREFNISENFSSKHQSSIIKFSLNNEDVIFCKPQTFMNSSGDALWEIKNFYKLKTTDFLVIYDELNLDVGNFKFSFLISDGGHNGVKNIVQAFGSKDFLKLRLGIGPRSKKDIKDFVLEKFDNEEILKIKKVFPTIFKAVLDFLNGISNEKLMNFYN